VLPPEKRAVWQQPRRVLDLLRVRPGSVVAVSGEQTDYFAIRAALRVGRSGRILALDDDPGALIALGQRAEALGLGNVMLVHRSARDALLVERTVDRALLVNVYAELEPDRAVPFLRSLARGLRSDGRLVIIDWRPESPIGPSGSYRIAPAVIISEAERAGLQFVRSWDELRYQYVLLFEADPDLPKASAHPKTKRDD
jgi:SAM-dependent methyltransferase